MSPEELEAIANGLREGGLKAKISDNIILVASSSTSFPTIQSLLKTCSSSEHFVVAEPYYHDQVVIRDPYQGRDGVRDQVLAAEAKRARRAAKRTKGVPK